jgi:hypothetical protein
MATIKITLGGEISFDSFDSTQDKSAQGSEAL